MWRGRLRVIEKGSEVPTKCFINLEDKDSGQFGPFAPILRSVTLMHSLTRFIGELFAQAPYKPTKQNPNGGCEAVLDSSRYFVLTVIDAGSGQKAYIGMGFPERTESFDFNVACVRRPRIPFSRRWANVRTSGLTLDPLTTACPSLSPSQPARLD